MLLAVLAAGCGRQSIVVDAVGSPGLGSPPCTHAAYVLRVDGSNTLAVVETLGAPPSSKWSVGEQLDYADLEPNTTVTLHDRSVNADFRVWVAYVVSGNDFLAFSGAADRANRLCES
jgi:hypothetical protein